MKPLPNLFGRASAVKADHEHLRSSWAELRKVVSAPPGTESSERTWKLIREFGAELRTHFAAEEAEYFGALLEEQPALLARIERLRAEHRAIAGLLAEVMALETRAPRGELESRLNTVLVRLEDHEHEERGLLQEFFASVTGGEG